MPVSLDRSAAADSPVRRTDWPEGTPIWLLDVDGVLNAVSRSPDQAVWSDYRSGRATASGRTWPITWSPTVTQLVADVHASGAAEVLWLTTWEDEANGDLARLLRLPPLPVAGRASDVANGLAQTWWKLQVARLVHEQDHARPLLWTDDDLAFDPDATAWISSRGLGISPETSTGLAPADLDAIARFTSRR